MNSYRYACTHNSFIIHSPFGYYDQLGTGVGLSYSYVPMRFVLHQARRH